MGYSSVRRVGEDIYSFLDFLSPRQGPNESTNPKPPEPPPQQVASADAGAVPGAGMSYPGTMSDADPGSFIPPRPDSTKPVQLAGALPSMAGGASPAMTMPGGGRAVMPPIPPKGGDDGDGAKPSKPVVPDPLKPLPPVLTSDKGTVPGTGSFKASPVFGGGDVKVPAFDPSTGKLDVLGILKEQQDAARRAAAMESFARGGTLMAAAATRSPSMRQVLAHAAGTGGGGGGDGSGGAGGVSAATLLELDKRSRGDAQASYKAKMAPLIGQRLGIPAELVQFMDDDKIATITTALAKGENLKREEREDGSVVYYKPDGTPAFGLSPDELKVQKSADVHAAALDTRAKTAAEIEETKAKTGKLGEEITQKKEENLKAEELRTLVDNPEFLQSMADQMGTTPSALRTAFSAGVMPASLQDNIKSTPLYQEWLKTDRSQTFTEYAKQEQMGRSNQPTPAKHIFDSTFKDATEGVKKGRNALSTSVVSRERYNLITQGNVMTGAVWGSDPVQKWAARMANVMGWDPKQIADRQKFVNLATSQAVARAKELGTNPTDRDLRIQQQIQGADTSMTAEALVHLAQYSVRSDVRSMIAANERLDDLARLRPNDPDVQRFVETNRIQIPNLVNAGFEADKVDGLRANAQAAAAGDPKAKEDLATTMADFDRMFGQGTSKYVLSQPVEEQEQ